MLLVFPFMISVQLMRLHRGKFLLSPVAGFAFSGPCNSTTFLQNANGYSFTQDLLPLKFRDDALHKLDALLLSAICS